MRSIKGLVSKATKKKKIQENGEKGKMEENNEKNKKSPEIIEKRVRFKENTEIIPQGRRSSSETRAKPQKRQVKNPNLKKRLSAPLGILKRSKKSDDSKTNNIGNNEKKLNPRQPTVNKTKRQKNIQDNRLRYNQYMSESVRRLLGYSKEIVQRIGSIEKRQESFIENRVSNSDVKNSSMFLSPNVSNISSGSKSTEVSKGSQKEEIDNLKERIRILLEEKIKHVKLQSECGSRIKMIRVRLKLRENSIRELENEKQLLENQLVDKERIIQMLQTQQLQPYGYESMGNYNTQPIPEPPPPKIEVERQPPVAISEEERQLESAIIQKLRNEHQTELQKLREHYEKKILLMKREKLKLLKNYTKVKKEMSQENLAKSQMLESLKNVLIEKERTIEDLEGEIEELNEGKLYQEKEIKDLERKVIGVKKKSGLLSKMKRGMKSRKAKNDGNGSVVKEKGKGNMGSRKKTPGKQQHTN